MTLRIASMFLLIISGSLVVGCARRASLETGYATLRLHSDDSYLWVSAGGEETFCGHTCEQELPRGPVRIGVSAHPTEGPSSTCGCA